MAMNCWSIMGLPADADKRSIKRQYAILLKRHRPDEDPEGFQRLREAYDQALEWADRKQQEQEQEPELLLEPLAPQRPVEPVLSAELDFPQDPLHSESPQAASPFAARRLAEQCLAELAPANFEDRLAQARLYDCEAEFEQGLLSYCLADGDLELADLAIKHFQWLSPWQRIDLPGAALERLRERLTERAWLQLAVSTGDSARFLELANTLEAAPWLQSLDGRRWLSERLAIALAQAPVWSQSLFDEICAQQGWKDNDHLCPQPWWSQLQQRSDRHTFLERQLRLAERVDTSESRAARMLFKDLSENSRVRLSFKFSYADWNVCEALYQTVQSRYPQLLDEVPSLNPDIWRPLRRDPPIMAVPVALIGASACFSWFQEYQLGETFYGSLLSMLLRVLIFGVIACFLAWFGDAVGRSLWPVDNWINKHFGRWLSLRRPTPLPIRESLWIWLLGAFLFLFGERVMLTYVGIITLMALWNRLDLSRRCASALSRLCSSATYEVLLGAFIGMLVPSVLLAAALAKHAPLPVNQGLQAWPQRICAARQVTLEPCPSELNRSQWYGTQDWQEDRP